MWVTRLNARHPAQFCMHDAVMHEAESVKYLGNIVSSQGGLAETIEDRRNKGWRKVMGILGEVALGRRRIEAGLLLRKTILVNSLLFQLKPGLGQRKLIRRYIDPTDHAIQKQVWNFYIWNVAL